MATLDEMRNAELRRRHYDWADAYLRLQRHINNRHISGDFRSFSLFRFRGVYCGGRLVVGDSFVIYTKKPA